MSTGDTIMEKTRYGEKVSFNVLLLNIILTIVKIIAGIFGNSIALIADAFHSLTDVITTVGVIISLRISRRPPDKEHPYGHGKIESIAAKIISLVLIILGAAMLVTAAIKIMEGVSAVPKEIAIWAAAASILVKEFSFRYTIRAANKLKSTILAADAWHHRSDALSSVAALFGIVVARLGYPLWDPIAAGIVSLFIVWAGLKILKTSIDELMDTLPDEEILKEIHKICADIDGVKKVRNVKVRKYGMYLIVDLTIVVDSQITVDEGHKLATITEHAIMESSDQINQVFTHVSPFEFSSEC